MSNNMYIKFTDMICKKFVKIISAYIIAMDLFFETRNLIEKFYVTVPLKNVIVIIKTSVYIAFDIFIM
jgi:hypothetical protein